MALLRGGGQCGSSQQAVHFAAQGVISGSYELAIAAGVENMSMVPILSNWYDGLAAGHGEPLGGKRWKERYGDVEISQFNGAELLAERFGLDRTALDEFALQSHQRAAAAWDSGRFSSQVVAVNGVTTDEGFRRDSTLEKLASLNVLKEGGRLTAATSSQISDGAAALLIASAEAAARHGLTPIARISGRSSAAPRWRRADDPGRWRHRSHWSAPGTLPWPPPRPAVLKRTPR